MMEALAVAGVTVTADQIYDLTLAATGSKAKAEKASFKHRWQELRQGITPQ